MKKTLVAIIAISVIITLSSIVVWNLAKPMEFSGKDFDDGKIVAISSFFPLYEFTKQVGGSRVDVSLLVPVGVEPHDWEPSIKDIQKLQQADIIVINGVGFENWVNDIDSVNSNVIIVDTSNGISIIESEPELIEEADDHNHDDSRGDPHIWLNPVLAQKQVENIADALSNLDPANSQYYKQNADSYIAKLDALDKKITNELSSCKKDFIAFHNAFSYFDNQYGLNQRTIVSNEPHEEPTSKSLENIITLAKSLNINIIFTEEAVDKRTSQVIANEIGGKVLTLSPLEVVEPQSGYIEKMEENLSNLKEALCN
jgi:zinc transport system substrate-binding protein